MAQLLGELCRLPIEMIDVSKNFAELGANSALLSQFVVRLNALSPPRAATITDVYLYPSVRSLATALGSTGPAPEDGQRTMETSARADARRVALSRRGAGVR
ncbi:acyl carrier protein [Dyella sp. 333MFSha]|uniref:acyl carrier protein n=1 Tax=Dyella sp. 333MFSha TaxID=1798240 RepID=UPI0015A3B5CA|nr:acyl carrier protein [Dyella sp. 333MFSha]